MRSGNPFARLFGMHPKDEDDDDAAAAAPIAAGASAAPTAPAPIRCAASGTSAVAVVKPQSTSAADKLAAEKAKLIHVARLRAKAPRQPPRHTRLRRAGGRDSTDRVPPITPCDRSSRARGYWQGLADGMIARHRRRRVAAAPARRTARGQRRLPPPTGPIGPFRPRRDRVSPALALAYAADQRLRDAADGRRSPPSGRAAAARRSPVQTGE